MTRRISCAPIGHALEAGRPEAQIFLARVIRRNGGTSLSSHAEAWRLAPDNGKSQGFSNVVEFALGVYGQLSMIQRDIGALTSSQQAIVERLDASEKHAEARTESRLAEVMQVIDARAEARNRQAELSAQAQVAQWEAERKEAAARWQSHVLESEARWAQWTADRQAAEAKSQAERQAAEARNQAERQAAEVKYQADRKESEAKYQADRKESEARWAQWTAERQAQEARWDARCNRIETRLENFEARTESRFHQIDTRFDTLETHVDKVETNLTRRIDANGQQIATLRERVNKVFWVATGGGIVLGLAYGWKPAIERMAGLIGP